MKSQVLSTLCVFALLLAGCGKSEKSGSAATESAAPAAATATTAFEVTASDSMKFNLTRLEVKAGKEVTITLTNVGTMAKNVMGHNLVVVKKDVDLQAFTNACVAAAASDYIPASMADKIIAHTKLLGAKQSDTITFTAPSEPGEYPFLCTFPAHYLAGMKGVLVVQ